jgi:hypothetical protein
MRLLKSPTFARLLADRLLGNAWTVDAVNDLLRPAAFDPVFRVPKLAARVLDTFAAKPTADQLAAFLLEDRGIQRALARIDGLPRFRPSLRRSEMEPRPAPLAGLVIPDLPTEAALADWLGTDVPHLRWLADAAGRNRKHRDTPMLAYRYRWIARKLGPPRLLEIPKRQLKQLQRKILTEICSPLPAHTAAYGFCRGRSIVTNAAVHCGKPAVLRFDLKDFFPSVHAARVSALFRTLGYPHSVARLLTGLCTTSLPADVWDARPGGRLGADFLLRQQLITRHLPQGAPTSPAIANLTAWRLDKRLSALAGKLDASYTRYADDLTFSGSAELARSRKRLVVLVGAVAADEGVSLNFRKTRLLRQGVRQHVTGVIVNVRPNIRREDFDQLKAILTNCIRNGPQDQNRDGHGDFRAYLLGRLSQVRVVHAARGEKLLGLFNRIEW